MRSTERPKLCLVHGYLTSSPDSELILHQGKAFDETLIGYSGSKPDIQDLAYVQAQVRTLLPGPVSSLFFRMPYSPVHPIQLKDIDQTVSELNPDLVHSWEIYSCISSQAADIARQNDAKLVISSFDTDPNLPIYRFPPYSLNIRKVIKKADLFIPQTKRSAQYLGHFGADADLIEVNYPGIDFSHIRQKQKAAGSPKVRILFVGRFDEEKGLSYLMEAFMRLVREGHDVELAVYAKPKENGLFDLVSQASREYPISIEYLPHQELLGRFCTYDIFCVPSVDTYKYGVKIWEEQFGYVFIEAMSAGLPIVTTDCGAIPEVVGPGNIVVGQRSSDGLYHALLRLVESSALRVKIGNANIKRARRLFDFKTQNRRLTSLLYGVLGD